CDYERARRMQQDEPVRLVGGKLLFGTLFGSLSGKCVVGMTHAAQGRVVEAERTYREVIEEAGRRGSACVESAHAASGLLAETVSEMNELREACALLEPRIHALEKTALPDIVLSAFLTLARARWLAGRRTEAFALLERLHALATQRGMPRLAAQALLE